MSLTSNWPVQAAAFLQDSISKRPRRLSPDSELSLGGAKQLSRLALTPQPCSVRGMSPRLTSVAPWDRVGTSHLSPGGGVPPLLQPPCLGILSYTLKCIQEISNKIFSVLYSFLFCKLSEILAHCFPLLCRSRSGPGQQQAPGQGKNNAVGNRKASESGRLF